MAKLSTCPVQHKLMYPTQTAAIRGALRSSRRRGNALRTYYHPVCHSWHLTKKPRVDIRNEEAS